MITTRPRTRVARGSLFFFLCNERSQKCDCCQGTPQTPIPVVSAGLPGVAQSHNMSGVVVASQETSVSFPEPMCRVMHPKIVQLRLGANVLVLARGKTENVAEGPSTGTVACQGDDTPCVLRPCFFVQRALPNMLLLSRHSQANQHSCCERQFVWSCPEARWCRF